MNASRRSTERHHGRVVRLALALALGCLLLAAASAHADRSDADELTVDRPYPMRVVTHRHVALFHWLDSLVGTSGGKTIPAHREQYVDEFDGVSAAAHQALRDFLEVRGRDLRSDKVLVLPGLAQGPTGLAWLRGVFLHFDTMDKVRAYLSATMEADDYGRLIRALDYFDARYEAIWNDGAIPEEFLYRFRKDPGRRRLLRLLARIARSMGVDMDRLPRPVIFLVPVPAGHGTHATAVGPYLLLEVRPADHLAEQASVIVHENAHYLFLNMDVDRRMRVKEMVAKMPQPAHDAWRLLNEALPTALGQGIADREFRAWMWSMKTPWYHLPEVDAYAKAIFPLVDETLSAGRRFDERFFRKAIELYEAGGTLSVSTPNEADNADD